MSTQPEFPPEAPLSSFWPNLFVAASLMLFLVWQIVAAAQQYLGLLRVSDQQVLMSSQASQAESKLQAMMLDLVNLAKTDTNAEAIVSKYGVKVSDSSQQASSQSLAGIPPLTESASIPPAAAGEDRPAAVAHPLP